MMSVSLCRHKGIGEQPSFMNATATIEVLDFKSCMTSIILKRHRAFTEFCICTSIEPITDPWLSQY
jgi:hypothetical protein